MQSAFGQFLGVFTANAVIAFFLLAFAFGFFFLSLAIGVTAFFASAFLIAFLTFLAFALLTFLAFLTLLAFAVLLLLLLFHLVHDLAQIVEHFGNVITVRMHFGVFRLKFERGVEMPQRVGPALDGNLRLLLQSARALIIQRVADATMGAGTQ